MKKIYYLLFVMLCSMAGNAANCISTTRVSVNYKTRQVTFKLTWTGCNGTTHLNKAWCFVDFQTVDAAGNKGAWKRATVSGAATVTNGTYAAGNTTGFYVTGINGQSATVTVKLGNTTGQFNWCAFASDYPPTVTTTYNYYKLRGTPPFTIKYDNTTTVINSTTFNLGCITIKELSDRTGAPGIIRSTKLSTGAIKADNYTSCNNVKGNVITESIAPGGGSGSYTYQWKVSYNGGVETVIPGATASTYIPKATTTAGTYAYRRWVSDGLCNNFSTGLITQVVKADNISISCPALGVSNLLVKTCDAGVSTWSPNNLCPDNWRWPTRNELFCMCQYKTEIGGFSLELATSYYWTANQWDANNGWFCRMADCNGGDGAHKSNSFKIRCVK